MIIKSTTKTAKGSPRKLRIPARVVKGMMLTDAISTLTYIPKEGARLINKTLKTALADAVHNFKKSENNLIVLDIRIDESMKLRRFRPAAKGMAKPFIRKYSHITVFVKDINDIETEIPEKKQVKQKVNTEKKEKSTELKDNKKRSVKKLESTNKNDIEEGEIVSKKPEKKSTAKKSTAKKEIKPVKQGVSKTKVIKK